MDDSIIKDFDYSLQDYKEREEERVMKYLSKKHNIPYLMFVSIKVEPDALQILDEKDAKEAKMAIFKKVRKKLFIILNDINNKKLEENIKKLEDEGYTVEKNLSSSKTLERVWKGYEEIIATSASQTGKIEIDNKDFEPILKNEQSLQDIRKFLGNIEKLAKSRQISKNIEYILVGAISLDASDIHIESTQEGGDVRYRLDGVLIDIYSFSKEEMRSLLTRLKLVSNMKINRKKEAQDGSFAIDLNGRPINIRASSIPEGWGESFVLRILDPNKVLIDISTLGIHPTVLGVFEDEISKPNGMIITTGPTGSGKTTTLYSFLSKIKNPEIKIITLEDPIEYRLPGIVQTQISEQYTFASGLRSILRQDPDVILVGEVRDEEVARTAIDASLTGHIVFSTLHTNDAIGALPRLAQLGINPNVFSSSLNIIIAQRLIRKLCPHCSREYKPTDKEKKGIEEIYKEFPTSYKEDGLDFSKLKQIGDNPDSCVKCNGGYKGRTGVYEVFRVNEDIEQVMRNNGGILDLKNVIKKQNLPTMTHDGLWKALRGETSLDELDRVLGLII